MFLDPGERVEADEGYVGHPEKIKCPQNVGNLAEKWAMQGRVRAGQEMLNGRLKNWGIVRYPVSRILPLSTGSNM